MLGPLLQQTCFSQVLLLLLLTPLVSAPGISRSSNGSHFCVLVRLNMRIISCSLELLIDVVDATLRCGHFLFSISFDQRQNYFLLFFLTGVQESIIECIRELDGVRVSPHLCPMDRRPDAITRTCNDVPCPPRWNTSDFSSCSRSCGGGVQTREVHCIHEVARGGSNTLPVGADLCPQPPPRAQQFCNMIDCPVEWKTGEWSQVTQFRVSRSLSLVNASLLTGPGHTSVALMGIE